MIFINSGGGVRAWFHRWAHFINRVKLCGVLALWLLLTIARHVLRQSLLLAPQRQRIGVFLIVRVLATGEALLERGTLYYRLQIVWGRVSRESGQQWRLLHRCIARLLLKAYLRVNFTLSEGPFLYNLAKLGKALVERLKLRFIHHCEHLAPLNDRALDFRLLYIILVDFVQQVIYNALLGSCWPVKRLQFSLSCLLDLFYILEIFIVLLYLLVGLDEFE